MDSEKRNSLITMGIVGAIFIGAAAYTIKYRPKKTDDVKNAAQMEAAQMSESEDESDEDTFDQKKKMKSVYSRKPTGYGRKMTIEDDNDDGDFGDPN